MTVIPQNGAVRTLPATTADGLTPASARSAAPRIPEETDPLDWTQINTPEKAVLSPALDPGVLYTLSTVSAALWPPAESSTPGAATDKVVGFRTIDVWAHIGKESFWPEPSRTISTGFNMDGTHPATPLQEDGLTGAGGGRRIQNALTVDAEGKTAHWASPDQYDDLTLAVEPKTGALRIDGHLGTVDTHLTSLRSKKDDAGSYRIHTEGTLNGVAMHADTIISGLTPHPNFKNTLRATISERGELGSADITRDYTADFYQPGSWLTISGRGTVAGIPTQMTTSSGLKKTGCLDSRTPEDWPLTNIGTENPLKAFFG